MMNYIITIASVIVLSTVAAANGDTITPVIAGLLDRESAAPDSSRTPLSGDGSDPIDRLLAEATVRFASFADGADEHQAELRAKVDSALQVIRDYVATHPPVVFPVEEAQLLAPDIFEPDHQGSTAEPSAEHSTITGEVGSNALPDRTGEPISQTKDGNSTPASVAVSSASPEATSTLPPVNDVEGAALLEHSRRLRYLGEELIHVSERLAQHPLIGERSRSETAADSRCAEPIHP